MKKTLLLLSLLIIAAVIPANARGSLRSLLHPGNKTTARTATSLADASSSVYEAIQSQYTSGKISADSVVSLALYHKTGNPELAERCLTLVADHNPRVVMELGVLYAFSPRYASRVQDGVKLLQAAADSGYKEANEYLGLYYFTHKDYSNAKTCFDAARPMQFGFAYTALGSMYMMGKGVREDVAKARENYHQAALRGYQRGMALYGFNLRTKSGGRISYPDSFFWLYIAGDLGDDAARTALYLPRLGENRGDSEEAKDATTALQFVEAAQTGKRLKNEPIYKDGFLPSLKAREQAAEQGDDWARYYLGSMNYNGDFLNQNYTQVLHYYEPIARNGKLPHNVLAVVHERLARMYSEGKGAKADRTKAAQHLRKAAQYGSLSAYKAAENIAQ